MTFRWCKPEAAALGAVQFGVAQFEAVPLIAVAQFEAVPLIAAAQFEVVPLIAAERSFEGAWP